MAIGSISKKKQVSILPDPVEIIAVERADSSNLEELFYQHRDYRRFQACAKKEKDLCHRRSVSDSNECIGKNLSEISIDSQMPPMLPRISSDGSLSTTMSVDNVPAISAHQLAADPSQQSSQRNSSPTMHRDWDSVLKTTDDHPSNDAAPTLPTRGKPSPVPNQSHNRTINSDSFDIDTFFFEDKAPIQPTRGDSLKNQKLQESPLDLTRKLTESDNNCNTVSGPPNRKYRLPKKKLETLHTSSHRDTSLESACKFAFHTSLPAKKKVSIVPDPVEIISVERADSSNLEELFYQKRDYRRFKADAKKGKGRHHRRSMSDPNEFLGPLSEFCTVDLQMPFTLPRIPDAGTDPLATRIDDTVEMPPPPPPPTSSACNRHSDQVDMEHSSITAGSVAPTQNASHGVFSFREIDLPAMECASDLFHKQTNTTHPVDSAPTLPTRRGKPSSAYVRTHRRSTSCDSFVDNAIFVDKAPSCADAWKNHQRE